MTPWTLGTIGIYLSAALSTVGFVGFTLLARFWRTRGGWHVFWEMAMISWVLDLATVSHLIGDHRWFDWVQAGTFAVGFPLVLGWRSWIIFDLQLWRRYRPAGAYGEADSLSEETHGA